MRALRLLPIRSGSQLFVFPSRLLAILAFAALSPATLLRAQSSNVQLPNLAEPSFGAPATTPTAVITGKPYQAELTMHIRRSLADGTISTSDSVIHEARDSSGRLVREVDSVLPATPNRPAGQFFFTVVIDLASRTVLTWSSLSRTGTLFHLPPPKPLNGAAPQSPEDGAVVLGHRMIQGLLCTGYSTHQTIAAGAIGNAASTSSRHEWWIDDDLRIKALEIFDDPQHGERTIQLVSLKRGEPDPARFHLPAGYAVREIGPPSSASVAAGGSSRPLDLANAPAVSHDDALAMLASQDSLRQRAGAAALVKEAQASTDPVVKDAIAYKLAGANVGLTEAQALAEFDVHHAETDCAGQFAPVVLPSVFTSEITLARYWDTLGYIYNRQGLTNLAQPYVESAFTLDPLAHYGNRLARMAERDGNTQRAIAFYRAALQAQGGDELKATMRERLRALTGDAADNPVPDDEPLAAAPAVPALNGAAFFDVVYSSSTATPDAEFVSGADQLRAFAPAVASQEAATFTLPDTGPENIVRRFQVTCVSPPGAAATCRIRALGAREARAMIRP